MSAKPPRFLDQVRDQLRVRHYSIRTEEAYLGWIKRYILFHGKRHPAEMGTEEVNKFLTHLAVSERVAASTQTQALSALLFLYGVILHRPLPKLDIVRALKPRRLPVVLTRDEIGRVLARLDGVNWIVGTLLYGAGVRLLECLRLRVKDVDFETAQITIREPKGNQERRTMLPEVASPPLQEHLEQVRALHLDDLAAGQGAVYLPGALERKYPQAARQWG